MPEATMICCDASEWMRNGDFSPNRFGAQEDALSLICSAKLEQNHENSVGLIMMGKEEKAEVLVNCTTDTGRLLTQAHKMKIIGRANILVALQTAQLALKHRKNKKQTQRIIIFVGSPVKVSPKLLIKAGKRLKKNNVAVDIINFGEEETNRDILNKFLKAVNSNNNSNLIAVESNTGRLLSDVLLSSPLFVLQQQIDDITGQPTANTGSNNTNPVLPNVNASEDPELWEAIQQSIREQEQREREAMEASLRETQPQQQSNESQPQPEQQVSEEANDEDEELLRALQMSMQENMEPMEVENNENNDISNTTDINNQTSNTQPTDVLNDEENEEDLLSNLISDLPGVTTEDVDVDELLGLNDENENENEEENNNNNNDKQYKD